MGSLGRGAGVAGPRTIWRLMHPVFKWNVMSALLLAATPSNFPHQWDIVQHIPLNKQECPGKPSGEW